MWLWEAFFELGTERQIGMGCGPIPRSAILAYAKEWGIRGDDFEQFHRIIRRVDSEFLDLTHKKPTDKPLANMVDATDGAGVRAVFGRLESRQNKGKLRKPN